MNKFQLPVATAEPKRADYPDRSPLQARSVLRIASQSLAVTIVCATPWLFGGVQAVVQPWLALGVGVALALALLTLLLDWNRVRIGSLTALPLVCGLGLVALQILPLSGSDLKRVSPKGAELRESLELPAPSDDALLAEQLGVPVKPDSSPVSLYPASTRRELAMLSVAVAMFLVGIVCFRDPRVQYLLCLAVALNGALLAFLGFAQNLAWNGRLFWRVELSEGGRPFGPFVNANNAGGFLNLCLAGALGWAFCAFARRIVGTDGSPAGRGKTKVVEPLKRLQEIVLRFVAALDAPRIASLLVVVWIGSAVLCTLSRGAALAMAGAGAGTVCLILTRKQWRSSLWVVAILVVAGAGLLVWLGKWASISGRIASLLDRSILTHGLIGLWQDSVRAVGDFWLTGTGLGTFRYVYGMYQERALDAWYYYAENQYLQVLIETGVVGLVLMLVMIGLVAGAAWRVGRNDVDRRSSAFAVAALFAIGTQVLQSTCDFGLFIPSNMLLFALLCGAIVGRTGALAPRGPRRPWFLGLGRLWAPVAIAVLLFAVAWGGRELCAVAAVEPAVRAARFARDSRDEVDEAIQEVSAGLQSRMDDAEAHRCLARLWILRYRFTAPDAAASADVSASDRNELLAKSMVMELHGRLCQSASVDTSDAKKSRKEPAVEENLVPALREFVWARRCCPLLAQAHLGIAELGALLGYDDRVSLDRVRMLAPADLPLLIESGLVQLGAGRRDEACGSWQRSLVLSDRSLPSILALAQERLSLQELVQHVLPESPQVLLAVASRKDYWGPQYADMRRGLAHRALASLGDADLPEDQKSYLRFTALAYQESYAEAARAGERAVHMQPRNLAWRSELAAIYVRAGNFDRAREHALVCTNLAPDRGDLVLFHKRVIQAANLSTLPAGTSRQ